jgi:hypothetical protein
MLQFCILSDRCSIVGGISPTLPLSISEKENLGKPKEEIRNLNEFEYM